MTNTNTATTTTTTTETLNTVDGFTRLRIADWRLKRIMYFTSQSAYMPHDMIIRLCQQILEFSDAEIMEEYLS